MDLSGKYAACSGENPAQQTNKARYFSFATWVIDGVPVSVLPYMTEKKQIHYIAWFQLICQYTGRVAILRLKNYYLLMGRDYVNLHSGKRLEGVL